jgi:microcystin-dependent protein
MTARNYSSTAESKTLSTSINNSVTAITLNSISTLPSAYPYTLVIDADAASEEIVTVVESAGGTTLTVVRGQDTTTAIAHDPGAVVKHMITPRDLREPQSHIEASSSYEIKNNGQDPAITTANIVKTVHGIGSGEGSVVGTAKSQTLTNKTISLTSNTITGSTAEFNTALNDGNFATLAGTETLTNKTLTSPTFTGTLTLPTSGPGLVPVGTVISTALSATISGWLLCDGSNVSRTTYAGLFAAIGTTYGSGDGSTTFGIPNLKGKVPVGLDATQTEFDTLGETGGAKAHTHTNSNTGTAGAHTHAVDPPLTATTSDEHSHTGPSHTHALTAHDHTGPSHSHTMAHTHNYNPPTTTTSTDSHSHTDTTSEPSYDGTAAFGSTSVIPGVNHTHSVTTSTDSHSHTLNIGDNDTDGSSAASTGLSGTAVTGSGLFNAASAAGGAADTAFDITEASGTSSTSTDNHGHDVNIASFTSGPVSVEHSHTISDTGSTSNLSPYIVLNYLIKH